MSKKLRIFLAGHNGLVGSAVLKRLKKLKYKNIIVADRKKLNLLDQKKVFNFLKINKIQSIIICAAKVGGIKANNNYKAEFIYENLTIQNNLIHGAKINNISNLIFLGSSCVYPKYCKQPIKEEYLLSGKLEKTNDAYAIAKIAGLKMCEAYNQQYKLNYICLMPTNLYGPNDNYDLKFSHFFPALISKIYNAKLKNKKFIKIWGNGTAKRELMYVDDLSNACEFFLKKKTKHTLINIGSGYEDTVTGYANFISKKLGIKLKFIYDKNKPTGTPRKKLNTNLSKSYGWESKTSLSKGFDITFRNFMKKK